MIVRRLAQRCVFVAVAVVAVSLAACGGAQSRLANHLERGKQYLDEGNFDKGGVEFRNALQIDPKNIEARLLSGKVSEHNGDYRAAVNAYRGVLGIEENNSAASAALGRILVFAGEPKQALDLIEPGLAKTPQDAGLLTVRAAARTAQKDLDGALADAEKAVEVAPDDEHAVAMLAALYRQRDETTRALELVRATVERSPRSVELREVLASLYAAEGDPKNAEAQLRKVVELRPNELARRTRLAFYLARTKRLDEAQQVLADAVKALPQDDQAKLQLADFVVGQRSREQGEKLLREFIASDDDNGDLKLGLGALLQRSGADAEARKVYDEMIGGDADSPKSFVARNRIASMQIAAGKLDDARQTIEEVLKANPRDLDALTLRGNLSLERGDAAAAISDLRTVLREQPEALAVRRALARAHLANRETALAEDVLREALRATPNDPALRVDLAQILAQSNRSDQAVTMLEETVQRAPTDPGAREMLVRAYLAKADLAAARTAADDLKTLRPDSPSGYYLAGIVARDQSRTDDAKREFMRAVELKPSAIDALAELMRLEIANGDSAAAIARVAAASSRQPNVAPVRNLHGEALFLTKDFRGAIPQFEAAIAATPDWWIPYRMLGLSKIALADSAGALATYEKGLVATRYDPNLATELASHYERLKRYDDAIRIYDELNRLHPGNHAIANNLAMLLVSHRTDKASLDRARTLSEPFSGSDVADLLDTHGWVRFKMGEVANALPTLKRASERAPDSRTIRFHLAMAQLEAGQRDEARRNLESALEGKETFQGMDEARSALARLKQRAG